MTKQRIAIVGAGITGLTAAYHLQKDGHRVDLFEKNSGPGGSMRTVKSEGWQVEYGPNTLLLKDQLVKDFIEEIGLAGEKIQANPQAEKRYILKNGELVALPGSVMQAVTTPLFSAKAKLRVLCEPFISKSIDPDQTVSGFVERRLGSEILDYAINPFVAGIFANNPEDLSLRHAFPAMHQLEQNYGSLIWGSFAGAGKRKASGRIPRELVSFKEGMQQLPQKIADYLHHIHFNNEVKSIERKIDGWFLFSEESQAGPFDVVIVNTPVYRWSPGFLSMDKEKYDLIHSVQYPPLSVLCLGFNKSDISHPLDGFGFLIPEKENRKILGALFSSTLFPGRAPDDHHLLTVFIGGGRQPELASLESEKLVPMVLDELRDLIGLRGSPGFVDHIYWPKSIPAYHVGYDEIIDAILSVEDENPGLFLAGNFRNGISMPDCIMNGMKLASYLGRG